MEDDDKDPEEVPEPSALSENQEAKNGVSTQEADGDPSGVFSEEAWGSLYQEEVDGSVKITSQRITNLQRDLTAFVTNIQTAADARESMRRKEVDEARKIRLERLENHVKSSQEKFEEITRGWSIVKEKATLQELREAQNSQQQLCALLLEDKKKFINDLQQEMKVGDERYVKDLRKEAEELDLMIERMEDHMKTLKKAYREEMDQIKRVYQQQSEVVLTRDVTEWDQLMKELWEKEQERLEQRKEKVEEYEAILKRVTLETMETKHIRQLEKNAKIQVVERENQQKKGKQMIEKVVEIRQKFEYQESKVHLACMKSRITSLQTEMKNLETQYASHVKRIRETRRHLSKQIKCSIDQYERIQKKIKHFAVADAVKFEEMWLTVEAEVKQLIERALVIDSLICKHHLGLAWERPPMAFMELSGPIQHQKEASQDVSPQFHTGRALQCSQSKGMMDASDGLGATHGEMCMEGSVGQGESNVEVEDKKLPMDTLKKVMEVLCDEVGFLIEDALPKVLAPLEQGEQTIVKIGSLLCSFGLEDEDVPKLAHFLLKYKDQQKEQTEDVCGELGESSDQAEAVETRSTSNLTSDLIHPNHVLPALKSFLKQHMRVNQQSSFLQVKARDSLEDEAYWESMGNIISEDKIKLWEVAEDTLNQYLEVLTEISELVPEAEGLWQQNTELQMLLQQSLVSRVIHQMP
ncbi:dynein regulatory complex protein 1 isoform X2 [Trachinotus anak]|uniref:dynein regulatory complex protein 1 isoform X2 n=1 Tax=Trachinotus anak TaxID=443729 RepID=UPI0039F22C4D